MFRYIVSRSVHYSRTKEQLERDYFLTKKEIRTKKNYTKKIKNRCFLCFIWFRNSWVHYYIYGNACVTCCGRITRATAPKQDNQTRLTSEESLFLLAVRKKWVLENSLHLPPFRRPKKLVCEHSPKEDIDRV